MSLSPANAGLREALRVSALARFREEEREREQRAAILGRCKPRPRRWKGLRTGVIGQDPQGVLEFLGQQNLWYDRIARREGCRGDAANGARSAGCAGAGQGTRSERARH